MRLERNWPDLVWSLNYVGADPIEGEIGVTSVRHSNGVDDMHDPSAEDVNSILSKRRHGRNELLCEPLVVEWVERVSEVLASIVVLEHGAKFFWLQVGTKLDMLSTCTALSLVDHIWIDCRLRGEAC